MYIKYIKLLIWTWIGLKSMYSRYLKKYNYWELSSNTFCHFKWRQNSKKLLFLNFCYILMFEPHALKCFIFLDFLPDFNIWCVLTPSIVTKMFKPFDWQIKLLFEKMCSWFCRLLGLLGHIFMSKHRRRQAANDLFIMAQQLPIVLKPRSEKWR